MTFRQRDEFGRNDRLEMKVATLPPMREPELEMSRAKSERRVRRDEPTAVVGGPARLQGPEIADHAQVRRPIGNMRREDGPEHRVHAEGRIKIAEQNVELAASAQTIVKRRRGIHVQGREAAHDYHSIMRLHLPLLRVALAPLTAMALLAFTLSSPAIGASTDSTKKKKSSSTTKKSSSSKSKKSSSTKSKQAEESAPEPTPAPTPAAGLGEPMTSSINSDELKEFAAQPDRVKQLIESCLALTRRNLTYAYGSADPANGGMDCSGFIYFTLREAGFPDTPRQANEQYVWVRKKSNFQAVLSKKSDTFEINDLHPGDLMFWTGTYAIDRDPPVTHTMIYLGTSKKTGNRLMVGSSDGRTYNGQKRYGVSVFDFHVASSAQRSGVVTTGNSPDFAGYGPIPGMR